MSVLRYPSVPCIPKVPCTPLCSVAVPRHPGLTKLCVHLLRCVRCRPRRPLKLSRWSSAAPPHFGSIRPGPLAAALSTASPPTPVVSSNPVACPRRWADGRPNSAYRPRGFDEVGPCSAPSSPSLRIPVSSSTFSFSPPPVSSALPAPPLSRVPCLHTFCLLWRARPSLRLLACTRALGCNRSPRRRCTFRRWPPLLLKPVWLCPLLAAFTRPCWLCPRAGWLFCVHLLRPPHCSLTARLPPTPKLT